jgi:hypothetical protein
MTEQRTRYQHYHFVHDYLREKCLHAPFAAMEDFTHEKATEHMKIAWVSIGMMYKSREDDLIGHDGIEVVPITIDHTHRGAIITFPTPERITEAFMSAIVVPNDLKLEDRGRSRYITLEYSPDRPNKTFSGGWGDGAHFNFGPGPEPTVENFRQAIIDHVRPKPGRINRLIVEPPKNKQPTEPRRRDISDWDED